MPLPARPIDELKYRNRLFFTAFLLTFYSCIKPAERGISGDWVTYTANYKHMTLITSAKTPRLELPPVGYEDEVVLNFKKDSTVDFPGIRSYDVPCIWSVKHDELTIRLDTSRLKKGLTARVDSIHGKSVLKGDKEQQSHYKAKYDSILFSKKDVADIKKAAEIYTGVYKVEVMNKGQILRLTSPTTDFYLLNEQGVRNGSVRIMVTVDGQ